MLGNSAEGSASRTGSTKAVCPAEGRGRGLSPPWSDLVLGPLGHQALPLDTWDQSQLVSTPISIIPVSMCSRKHRILQGAVLCYCGIEPLHSQCLSRSGTEMDSDKSRVQ